jgi:hypothetical protein
MDKQAFHQEPSEYYTMQAVLMVSQKTWKVPILQT